MPPCLHWFRKDLRLNDNPAFSQATLHGDVLALYIRGQGKGSPTASHCWLHNSLSHLQKNLDGALNLYEGDEWEILWDVICRFKIEHVTWTRSSTPLEIERDRRIKQALKAKGITVNSFNGSFLWEPWTGVKSDGSDYRVFTAFYHNCLKNLSAPSHPVGPAGSFEAISDDQSLFLDDLKLLPDLSWTEKITQGWPIGEDGAKDRWDYFRSNCIKFYDKGRDFPSYDHVSRLSPHLHFGEISVHRLWHDLGKIAQDEGVISFSRQLIWREFSAHQLYFHPHLSHKNLRPCLDHFPWQEDHQAPLKAWQRGMTGIPFVDAGMRQLFKTGTMHNRVRMIVGSFLVKNLQIHWHHGAKWFLQTLFDADLANNSAGWQWIAGCGWDCAPYFRVFNPVTQGQRFDEDGHYVREFVPQLSKLPHKYIHCPWQAPPQVLEKAGVRLGENYPFPLVDLKQSRQQALKGYQHSKTLIHKGANVH